MSDTGETRPEPKTDDDTARQLVHTLAHASHANCIDLLSLELWGRRGGMYFPLSSRTAQSQAGTSCDEPPTNLKVIVGVKVSNGNHGRSVGPSRGKADSDGSTR